MSQHTTAQRAADTLNELIEAHVSDEPSEIDVHDAMARRDDLRELAEELQKEGYELPEEGDVLLDPESNPRFGDGRVSVTNIPDTTADEHYCRPHGRQRSIASLNPDHPSDAPVVEAQYVEGSDKVYSFPVTRLEEL